VSPVPFPAPPVPRLPRNAALCTVVC